MAWKKHFSNRSMLKSMPRISSGNCLSSNIPNCSHPPRFPSIAPIDRVFFLKSQTLNNPRNFCSGRSSENLAVRHQTPTHRRIEKAQAALTDYLNGTRGIYFSEAEYMSKNSPIFLRKLLEEVEDEEETDRALRKYLRYHPINEFELLFESIGLQPSEFSPFLPQDLMFLSDEEELLNNCRELSNYGIARNRLGRLYKKAGEAFKYAPGLLKSKLLAYERLGLSRSTVTELVVSSPSLLVGDVNKEVAQLLKELERIGLPSNWIEGNLSEKNTYKWGKMLLLLHFFKDLGFTDDELGALISRHPSFLLDASGKAMFSMISFLLKMGARKKEISALLSEFPPLQLGSFVQNLHRAFQFLVQIDMDDKHINQVFLSHTKTLGAVFLMKASSICTYLNVGTKRLCRLVMEDPNRLQEYAVGMKVPPLPSIGDEQLSAEEKKKFLHRCGFAETSADLNRALRLFRGKGNELQERFDFLVKAGFETGDVLQMVRKTPAILTYKIVVLEEKLAFLLNTMRYPLNSLVVFPQCMLYTTQRVKVRHLMYHWLVERGRAAPGLALASIVACSEKKFVKNFVRHHPDGHAVWDRLKNSCSG